MKIQLVSLFVCLLASLAASAQETFPSRAISLVVAFPPGGVADITGRPTERRWKKSSSSQSPS